ncbi:phosphatase PAP2 family protein [Bifidobacterium moukalabense]|uniref:PAP2 family protein n=1 Tax=Bifidobacterium moukalabense DSM 27321 TaxID=1435051 RepID=W4N6X7_9BIFI|nr:phosphatase PAP2 family protein [Bifidobacterium moukalabense]ETY70405.1 PAP2 family protein [Bifidobacterium moukalabense DSM 27321]
MHTRTRTIAVVVATALLCAIVPMIGISLRNSVAITSRETNILQNLARLPEGLRDCSAVLAFMFSTIGCIALLVILAGIDLRITKDRKIVVRDVIVSATPILYVNGIKWLVERPRPITSVGSGLLPGDPSFPSGHTAAAVIVSVMMILTVRNLARKRFPDGETDRKRILLRRAVIGGVAIVITVACSRLLLGLHFPTDVLTSATVCPLISYAVWCVWNVATSSGK